MGFGSLLGAIGLAALKSEIKAAGRRVAVAGVGGVLLLAAVCFAIAAFAVWLAGEIGTIGALLVIAGGFLALMLVVQGVSRLAGGRRRHRPAPSPPPTGPAAAEPQTADEAVPPGSEIGAGAIVALVGFLLGRQMLQRGARHGREKGPGDPPPCDLPSRGTHRNPSGGR